MTAPAISRDTLIHSLTVSIDEARDHMRDLTAVAGIRPLTEHELAEFRSLSRFITGQMLQLDRINH